MKQLYTFIILILPVVTICAQERILSLASKDSINGKPKYKTSIGANIKLAGAYDVYGGLQNSITFNVGNIDVRSDDDTPSFQLDMNQTQVKWESTLVTQRGRDVNVLIELDFLGGNGHARLRKAFVEVKHWQLGLNWNNFGDEALWPNVMEWEGPPSGIWLRTPHIKYFNNFSNPNWIYELSLEAPISDYNRYAELEPLVEDAFQNTPDFTAAIAYKRNWGHIRLVSLLRKVNYKLDGNLNSFAGYGLGLSGKYQKSLNNFQFQITGGKGINAYLTTISGFGYDGYPTIEDGFNATPVFGGWASYEYFFTPKLHCNLVFGSTSFEMNDLKRFIFTGESNQMDTLYLEGNLKNKHYYALFNVMYNFMERLSFGLELDMGTKQVEGNGTVNGVYEITALSRDAMRISFGFFYFL